MSALVIWRISDGRAGHDNQSAGLAEALSRRLESRTHVIHAGGPLMAGLQWLRGSYRPAVNLPRPSLIIGAGRRTHPDLLAARRYSGAPAIVIMRPGLPYSWFDLCLVPEHDQPPVRDNIIRTRGALNRMQPGRNDPGRGLILVGGPSRHHYWDEESLINQIERITARSSTIHWTITDSPRTPACTRSRLMRLQASTGIRYQKFGDCPPGWLAENLPDCGHAWVSEDSISMIHEALTAGARVGLLQVPANRHSGRVGRAIEQLIRDGFVTSFETWKGLDTLRPPPELLNEAARCADLVQQRFLGQQSS